MATVAILLHGHSVSIRLCVCLVNLISAFSLIETPQYNFGLCTDNTRARITLGRNTTAKKNKPRITPPIRNYLIGAAALIVTRVLKVVNK